MIFFCCNTHYTCTCILLDTSDSEKKDNNKDVTMECLSAFTTTYINGGKKRKKKRLLMDEKSSKTRGGLRIYNI